MKTELGLILIALMVCQNTMAAEPKNASHQGKDVPAKFYDFSEQTISGEIHKPALSMVEGRTKVKFECEEFENDFEQWKKCMEGSFTGFTAPKKKCCEGKPGEALFCEGDRIKYKGVGNTIKSIEGTATSVNSDFDNASTPSCKELLQNATPWAICVAGKCIGDRVDYFEDGKHTLCRVAEGFHNDSLTVLPENGQPGLSLPYGKLKLVCPFDDSQKCKIFDQFQYDKEIIEKTTSEWLQKEYCERKNWLSANSKILVAQEIAEYQEGLNSYPQRIRTLQIIKELMDRMKPNSFREILPQEIRLDIMGRVNTLWQIHLGKQQSPGSEKLESLLISSNQIEEYRALSAYLNSNQKFLPASAQARLKQKLNDFLTAGNPETKKEKPPAHSGEISCVKPEAVEGKNEKASLGGEPAPVADTTKPNGASPASDHKGRK